LGIAERELCKNFVPNWTDILTGEDSMAMESLRSCVILKLCLNILDVPAIQNLYVNELRIVDIILNTGIEVKDLKESLLNLFQKQLGLIGIVHSGEWPEHVVIGKSNSANFYDFYIDENGALQE